MTNVLEDQVSPMDFAVFPRLKAKMRGYHFRDLDELHYKIKTISSRFEESWYADIYKEWVESHLKCTRTAEECFEKLWQVHKIDVTSLNDSEMIRTAVGVFM